MASWFPYPSVRNGRNQGLIPLIPSVVSGGNSRGAQLRCATKSFTLQTAQGRPFLPPGIKNGAHPTAQPVNSTVRIYLRTSTVVGGKQSKSLHHFNKPASGRNGRETRREKSPQRNQVKKKKFNKNKIKQEHKTRRSNWTLK